MRLATAAALLIGGLSLSGCSRPDRGISAPRIGLITDVAGRGDGSFNDAALRGLEGWAAGVRWTGTGYRALPTSERAALLPSGVATRIHPLEVRPIVLLSRSQEDYEPNLQLAVDQGAILTIGNGFMLENALEAVARKNPAARFMLVDSPLFDASGKTFTLPNVRSITFREEEGSFLAGVLAARLTRTGKVGFVGGMALPLIERFEVGFRAGVASQTQIQPLEARVSYTGGFDNVSRGKQVAASLLAQGVDVLFHAAGGDGLGVIQAANEAHLAGRPVFAIGCDSDQHHLAPSTVVSSMLKRVDLAVYQAARNAIAGTLEAGHHSLGLKDEGVALAPLTLPPERSQEGDALQAALERYAQRIRDGRLPVPDSRKALGGAR